MIDQGATIRIRPATVLDSEPMNVGAQGLAGHGAASLFFDGGTTVLRDRSLSSFPLADKHRGNAYRRCHPVGGTGRFGVKILGKSQFRVHAHNLALRYMDVNSESLIYVISDPLSNIHMDIDSIRRQNIKALEDTFETPADFAKAVGMAYAQYVNLRDGAKDSKTGKPRGMRKETAWRFEDVCNKPRGWLDQKHGEMEVGLSDQRRAREDTFEISVYGEGVSGSMGTGSELVDRETVIDSMRLTGDWFRQHLPGIKPENVSVISGRGNSMEPTFSDGDLLLIHTAIKAVDIDGIYALRAHNRLFIKTVRQRMDGSFEISSDNPSVKTVDVLNGGHDVEVVGRVVWAWNGKRL